MKLGETGTYEVSTVGGESVLAFIPAPLPPHPPLDFGAGLQRVLESAVLYDRYLAALSEGTEQP